MRIARTIAAFLIAPLITPIVLLGVLELRESEFNFEGLQGIFIMVAGFAYVATLVFGIPAFFLFRAKRWTGFYYYVIAGALIGAVVCLTLNQKVSLDIQQFKIVGLCALAGGTSALIFRILAGTTRYDDSGVGET